MSVFANTDVAAFHGVWVFCEQREGKLRLPAAGCILYADQRPLQLIGREVAQLRAVDRRQQLMQPPVTLARLVGKFALVERHVLVKPFRIGHFKTPCQITWHKSIHSFRCPLARLMVSNP